MAHPNGALRMPNPERLMSWAAPQPAVPLTWDHSRNLPNSIARADLLAARSARGSSAQGAAFDNFS